MNPVQQSVPYVVYLSPALARRVADHVDDPATPYRDVSDLAAVAFRNQIALESTRTASDEPSIPRTTDDDLPSLLERSPLDQVPAHPAVAARGPLSFLTNRLNPFVVVARVAANLGPSTPGSYVQAVEVHARAVGLRLAADDAQRRLKQAQRRSTSWPTGDDDEGSLDKFRVSYLLDTDGVGPAVDARVLTVTDAGLVACTPEGARLAAAPCPFLDGPDDGTLLSREAVLALRDAVLGNPEEAEAIRLFVDAVESVGGSQPRVDNKLAMSKPKWSEGQVHAHRAAMIGRLRDLDVVEVDGRGIKAVITVVENPFR